MTNNKSANRFYSAKQELRVANELRMKTVPNSGATPFKKGDLKDKYLLVECKTKNTPQLSHTMRKDWIDGIEKEAFEANRMPALVFDFGDGDDIVCMRMKHFKKIYESFIEYIED